MNNRILTIAQVREFESKLFAKEDSFAVMTKAATAVAKHCEKFKKRLIFVAGRGNNGGDAILAANILYKKKRKVAVYLPLGVPKKGIDAYKAYEIASKNKVKIHLNKLSIPQDCVIVDGLFGIGFERKLFNEVIDIINEINNSNVAVISIDVPSGLSANTGAVNPIAIKARKTISFFSNKPGLLMRNAKDYVGEIIIDDLGYSKEVADLGGVVINEITNPNKLVRKQDSHKGSFGSAVLIGGNDEMLGALVLASRAATLHGAGKVYAMCIAKNPLFVDINYPEIMWVKNLLNDPTAIGIGVGLGISQKTKLLLTENLKINVPIVIDADALNLIAKYPQIARLINKRISPTILTPHPAEAARILNTTTAKVQDNRIESALSLASKTKSTVLLKGAGTVVANYEGKWGIVPHGNPALAQGGSGDVLTGIIVALLAQGMNAWEATTSAAYLHAKSADILQAERGGVIGISLKKIMKTSASLLSKIVNQSCTRN